MAKKVFKKSVPSKIRRSRSMEQCLEDGKDYLDALNEKDKRIAKEARKSKRTKTMVRTVEEGRKLIAPRVATGAKQVPRTKAFRPTKPSLIAMPAVPSPPAMFISSVAPINKMPSYNKTVLKTSSKALPMPAAGLIDICFCLDTTGSMGGELARVQTTIEELINKIEAKVMTEGITLRFSIVSYKDHGDHNMIQAQDFTDANTCIDFVKKLYASGGGDEPEAAHDGLLHATTKLNWVDLSGTPMLRYIFHILDAPPHGKEFGTHEPQEGCKCGIKTDTILHEINMRQIHYRMIKVRNNPRVDMAQKLFKGKMGNFDSADIQNAPQMDIRVSDMVMMEVLPVSA